MRLIGESSVATVFLARETKPERLVALKVLKAEFAADAAMRARFKADAIAASAIVHPNVAAVYRLGERADGLPYVAQEYIGGQSLSDVLGNRDVLTVEDSTRVLFSLAKALAALHAKHIVHGDVTLESIIIERDGGRVVLDVGIGGPREGDVATEAGDIIGVGVIAYQLFAGRAPDETIDLQSVRSDLSGELAQIIDRCVSKNPEERPTAQELVRVLAVGQLADLPQHAMPPTQGAAEASLMRVAVIAGLVIMAIGAAVGLWIYVHYSERLG